MKSLLSFCLIFSLLCFKTVQPLKDDISKWIIIENSSLVVHGVTNVNKFSCAILPSIKTDTIMLTKGKSGGIVLSGAIHIKIDGFKSSFVGPIIGCYLRLVGTVCLHASVVNINGKAVLFSGDKRTGKSTTAAAFVSMGYHVLSDDLAVIIEKNGHLFVAPGYAKVRLRPASASFLLPDKQDEMPMVYTRRDSRYQSIDEIFHETALPLGSIYMLKRNKVEQSSWINNEVSAKEQLIDLCRNTFGNYVVTGDQMKNDFVMLGKIAREANINHLNVKDGLENLELQCMAVINDLKVK